MIDSANFRQLLALLGRSTDTHIRLAYEGGGTPFGSKLIENTPEALDAFLTAADAEGRNLWFEVNPSTYNLSYGRSSGADITRLTSLYVDIDYKPKRFDDGRPQGMGSMPEALDYLQDLIGALGAPPSAIVHSGHGMQAYWPIDDGHRTELGAEIVDDVLSCWKQLATQFAHANGGGVDQLFDLPRIFRVPGPRNWKNPAKPAETSVEFPAGSASFSLGELLEIFEEHEVFPDHTSEVATGELISAETDWEWADHDCEFVEVIRREIETSTPAARHGWSLKIAAIIHGMIRGGCVTRDGFSTLMLALNERMTWLTQNQAPIRPLARDEVGSALRWGRHQAQLWSDEKLGIELRQHTHRDILEQLTVPPPVTPLASALEPTVQPEQLATVSSIFSKNRLRPTPAAKVDATAGDVFGALAIKPEVATRLSSARYTDVGNAELLGQHYAATHRHVAGRGWLHWDGTRWTDDIEGSHSEHAKDMMVQRLLVTTDDTERDWWRSSLSRGKLTAMIELAKTLPHLSLPAARLNEVGTELNTPGGVVDLTTGTMRPADPLVDLHTQRTNYTPDPSVPTPLFSSFIHWAFSGDQELIAYVQRLFGIALIGTLEHHIFPIFLGSGANGKTTLFDIGLGTLGDYAEKMPQKFLVEQRTEPHPEVIAKLRGVRLALASEAPPNAAFDEELVKAITGERYLKGRLLYENSQTFRNQVTLMAGMNHLPTVRVGGPGFYRRVRRIDMKNRMPLSQQDPQLVPKILTNEGPGVLAWMIRGALEVFTQGGELPPSTVMEASRQYQLDEDQLARFLAEHTIDQEHSAVNRKGMYEMYKQWCYRETLAVSSFPVFQREILTLKPRANEGARDAFARIAYAPTQLEYEQ